MTSNQGTSQCWHCATVFILAFSYCRGRVEYLDSQSDLQSALRRILRSARRLFKTTVEAGVNTLHANIMLTGVYRFLQFKAMIDDSRSRLPGLVEGRCHSKCPPLHSLGRWMGHGYWAVETQRGILTIKASMTTRIFFRLANSQGHGWDDEDSIAMAG